ncbi:MAG: Na+/H+ antiporter NhaA [Deltaproteobacteria bacterium]|nr:Na+/H+ antiporter NhaA [Deltaproteobacteria bacterium]
MNRNSQDELIKKITESVIRPFERFFKREATSGIILILAAAAAMIIANSPLHDAYHHLWETSLGFSLGSFTLEKSLHHWINDGLMAIFFFVVGLEIKREILIGELASPRKAALPIAAAIGGMVMPAAFYIFLNTGKAGAPGWAIPMATDIAFALGCLALLGKGIPSGILIFLTALAIVDDLGGILVIALFYTDQLSISALIEALILLALSFMMNRFGVRKTFPYVLVGLFLWLALLKSGIHATVAGILLAMTIPASTAIRHSEFIRKIEEQLCFLQGKDENASYCALELDEAEKQSVIQSLEQAISDAEAPLEHIEHSLHPWVIYLIMPLFAFANAGLKLDMESLTGSLAHPVFLGTILGLVAGKQIGIFLFSWLTVKSGIASLPEGVRWSHIYGVSILAGIGFTMSLFIGNLAFHDNQAMLETAKLGILVASILSGILGMLVLKKVT